MAVSVGEVGALAPSFSLLKMVEEKTGLAISRCFQCQKCTNGCPVSDAMDLKTHEVVRLVQFGARDRLLAANSIWLCVSCRTCEARCPNDIDSSRIMEVLRNLVQPARRTPTGQRVEAFHSAFLGTVRQLGRAYELGLIGVYKIKTGTYSQDLSLGLQMLKRRKLKLWPEKVRHLRQVREIFRRAEAKKG